MYLKLQISRQVIYKAGQWYEALVMRTKNYRKVSPRNSMTERWQDTQNITPNGMNKN